MTSVVLQDVGVGTCSTPNAVTYSASVATDDASDPHTDDVAVSATATVPVEASSLVTKDGECFSSQKMGNVFAS